MAIPAQTVVAGSVGSGGGLLLTYTDVNGVGKLMGWDFFVLGRTSAGSNYQLQLFWLASGSRIVTANVPP